MAQHLLEGQRILVRRVPESREKSIFPSTCLITYLRDPSWFQKIFSEKEGKCSWLNLIPYTLASVPDSTVSFLSPVTPHFQSILQFSLLPFDELNGAPGKCQAQCWVTDLQSCIRCSPNPLAQRLVRKMWL